MKDVICNYNGHLVSIYEPYLSFANRAFRYGDALFETIRVVNGKVMFLNDHMRRIKVGMTLLKMKMTNDILAENIEAIIRNLINVNKLEGDVRARLTVFRNEGGYYTPDTNEISFLIETEETPGLGYVLNETGLQIDIYAELQKNINKLSSLKTGNALLYVLAGVNKKENKLDDVIITNQIGNICESVTSNIFIVKNGALYTPLISEGCIDGVMRKQILMLAQRYRILCYETTLALNSLLNADEILLTNAMYGIQWVSSYKTKTYGFKMANFLNEKLNLLIEEKELI